MAKRYKQPDKDTWVRDYAGTNKKVNSYIKSQGGNEWDITGFRNYMDYHTAHQDAGTKANTQAVDTWNKSYSSNLQKQKKQEDTLNEQIKKSEAQRKQRAAQQKKSLLPKVKNKSLWDDVKDMGKLGYNLVNPFDGVSIEQATKNYANRNHSNTYSEIQRGANRLVDSASFTAMSNFDKKLSGKTPDYLSKRKVGEGGVTDFVTSGLGYLVPGSAEYKALNSLKVGKALTQFGSKGIGHRLAAEGAKGAIVGAGLSIPEVGVKEALNPQDQNWKDNLKYIGTNTALGAIADPLLYGAGKGIGKGFESASNRTMKNLLPTNHAVSSELSSAYKSANALPIANKSNPFVLRDLLPNGNPIAKPNYVPDLAPRMVPKAGVPQVGRPELPPLNEVSMLDRASMLENTNRPLPDFSTAKPVIEPPSNVNVYGVEMPKVNLVDTAPPAYWQKRYEEFANFIKASGYDENNLSYESINELWSHFAKPEEPPLSTVVDLAYKGYKDPKVLNTSEVWDKMGNRPPVSQNAKNIILGNKPVKRTPVAQTELPKIQEPVVPTQPVKTIGNATTPELPSSRVEVPMNAPQTAPKQTIVPSRPENIPYIEGERKHYSTLANSEKAPKEFVDRIKNLDRKIVHTISDKDATDFANGLIQRDPEEAFQFVKNAEIRDKRHTVTGARLIDEFNKQGNFERAVDMADVLAKEGTKFGQGLQSFSVYNKLSVEGHLIRAARTVARTNEMLPAGKQIVLTPEIAHDIAASADSIQKLTGQQEIGKNVISLLEHAKKKNRLTDEEVKVVRSFLSDVKKYMGDLDANVKPPKVKQIQNVRVRDNVVDFMSKQEMEAKKRIAARRNRANSLPVDIFYDYSVVGASKIAKGAVKFADFSEQMVKEFSEEIKPYMQQIYNKAVETFNITSDKITPNRLTQAEKIVNKAIEDKTLSSDMADELLRLTKNLVNAAGDSKFDASMDLQVALNKLEQPTFSQMIESTRYQAMLLNPLTIVRNVIGNEVFYRIDRASKVLTVPLDMITAKITGNQRTIAFNTGQFNWRNFFNPTKDFGKGMKIGTKAGWKGVNPLGINTAYDIKSPAFSSDAQNLGLVKKALVSKFNPLHWSEKVLGVTMRSFDTAGYMRAYNQTLREQATLKAINEGLKGKALRDAAEQYFREADDNMIAIADQYGKYATFQDNTSLARGLTKGKEKLNEVSTYAITGGLGKTKETGLGSIIIPFPKTPANLVMRAIDYSPAGMFRSVSLIKDYMKLGKNPLDAREAQLAFGRSLVGTGGFSLLGFVLANKGVLTSAGDSDYEVRELEKMAGKQPNSVNISAVKRFIFNGYNEKDLDLQKGDTFVSYDWMQPVSISIALGTGVSQAYKETKDPTTTNKILGAADSAANTIVNMSSLAGINKLISGPPNEGWSEKIAGSVSSVGGSFIPTFSNQFRKLDDNQTRSTYEPTFKGKFNSAALNRLPGYEKKLPPSYNTLGNKKETYQNGTNNIMNVFANPSFVSKYQPTPEAKFLLDYMNKTGDKSLVPRIPDKKLDGVALTGSQYAELQRIMGTEVQKGVKNLLPRFKGSNDTEAIADELKDILSDAGKKARGQIRSKMVSQRQLDEARKKYGLDADTIYKRLDKGMTLNKALTTPYE